MITASLKLSKRVSYIAEFRESPCSSGAGSDGSEAHRFSIMEGEDHMVERRMDGGEVFNDILNRHGVQYIIGSPGSEWPPMWEGVSRRRAAAEQAPTYVNCRHEVLAVGVAAGYHRATGKLPVVMLHTTSGGLN